MGEAPIGVKRTGVAAMRRPLGEPRQDGGDIGLGFPEGRHAAVAVHGAGAGVIGGQRQAQIAAVAVHHPAQISCAAMDVLADVVAVDAEIARRAPRSAA